MGVIQDFVDGLQTWIENLFKDGIKSQFSSIGDLIKTSFDPNNSDTGVSGLVSNFLTTHPANFTGASGSSGTTIWQTIETLCNNAVVPIAGIIFAILMINDLIQMVLRGNNFKDFDDSIFVKWIIKTLCGTILISNVYYLTAPLQPQEYQEIKPLLESADKIPYSCLLRDEKLVFVVEKSSAKDFMQELSFARNQNQIEKDLITLYVVSS